MVSDRHVSILRLGLVLVCMFAGSAILMPSPALADLRVCNRTANTISVALGYKVERGWQSEGWWLAPPGQCALVFQGALNARFFYIFAADDIGGGSWGGSVFMCTRDESFTIFGVEDCLARGYERTGFFEVDTQSRTDWMLQLVDGGRGPESAGSDAPDQVVSPDDLTDVPLDSGEETPITEPGMDAEGNQ